MSEQLPWNRSQYWRTPGGDTPPRLATAFCQSSRETALTWQEEEAGALFSSESPADWELLARPRERRPAALCGVSSLARAPRACPACVRASP